MKKRLKITEGKAVTLDHNWSDTSVCINGKSILTLSIYDEATEDTQEALEVEMDANAELIADAFNTANETDKMPSEIKQGRDEILEILKGLVCDVGNLIQEEDIEWQQAGYFNAAKELINKIKDNE